MATRPAGTLYRGKVGMWSWVLHRITGVAIFFFLLVHVLDTALVRVSPEAYNVVIESYKTPIVGLAELGLVIGILFHGLNGLRIIAVDFWSKGTKYQNLVSSVGFQSAGRRSRRSHVRFVSEAPVIGELL